CPSLSRRIGHHHFCLCTNVLVRLAQVDGIPITFRHLAPIESRYPRSLRQNYTWLDQATLTEEPAQLADRLKNIVDPDLHHVLSNPLFQAFLERSECLGSPPRRHRDSDYSFNMCQHTSNRRCLVTIGYLKKVRRNLQSKVQIEFPDDLTGELHMRNLILADRH